MTTTTDPITELRPYLPTPKTQAQAVVQRILLEWAVNERDVATAAWLSALVTEGTLVHAWIGPHCRFHAWVECGDTILDLTEPMGDRCYQRPFRHEPVHARRAYSVHDLIELQAELGHCGPW